MDTGKRKIHELEAIVQEVVVETPDTVTLVLFAGNEPHDYRAGQFVNVDIHQFKELAGVVRYFEEVKKRKEPVRSYSLASAPHEKHLAITIKEELYVPEVTRYPPVLSPVLVHKTPVGTPMKLVGFSGPYVLPDDVESRTDHLVHLVAGSGSVPNFSILKDALHRGLKLRHTFIYSNKSWDDICFRAQLEELERHHPDKLRVVHTLTREPDEAVFGPNVRKGRISVGLLSELIPDPKTCLVYLCGPAITPWDRKKALETRVPATPRFLETALEYLHTLGITNDRIKRESYG